MRIGAHTGRLEKKRFKKQKVAHRLIDVSPNPRGCGVPTIISVPSKPVLKGDPMMDSIIAVLCFVLNMICPDEDYGYG
jgi:hypothetical protein